MKSTYLPASTVEAITLVKDGCWAWAALIVDWPTNYERVVTAALMMPRDDLVIFASIFGEEHGTAAVAVLGRMMKERETEYNPTGA